MEWLTAAELTEKEQYSGSKLPHFAQFRRFSFR
jgi:hypothetical protein